MAETVKAKKPKKFKGRIPTFDQRPQMPSNLGCTLEEWRLRKRAEGRAIVAAIDTYVRGSAYTPRQASRIVHELSRMAERLLIELDGNWGVNWE